MRRMNYYNENDPFCAEWLRNLIDAGHVPGGDVDERSIEDVTADDVQRYTQCHWFAGIGGWSLALHLAGWPNERPVWTGSCPCQPFSSTGKRKGATDERHLWPAFFRLIAQCKPPTVFGEQVASKDGREWMSAVRLDLESLGYACGAADLPAASVGAPHIRQRLWWVADARYGGRGSGEGRGLRGMDSKGRASAIVNAGESGIVGDAEGDDERRPREPDTRDGRQGEAGGSGAWGDIEYIPCADGKARPTQPGIFPLADGPPGRVGRLCAYGNAIVPQVAAAFIQAHMGPVRGSAENPTTKPARPGILGDSPGADAGQGQIHQVTMTSAYEEDIA